MDEYNGKKAVGRFSIGGRGSGLAFREASSRENRSGQFCNRLVCSNRPNSRRSALVGSSERDKFASSLCSTSGKATVGSSSKTCTPVTNLRKPHSERQNSSSRKETVPVHADNMQVEGPSSSSEVDEMGLETIGVDSWVLKDLSLETFAAEVESNNLASSRRTRKPTNKRSGQGNKDTSPIPSTQFSFAYRNTSQVAKSSSHGQGYSSSTPSSSTSSLSRYGLRNLRCASISDILPPGRSSSDPSHTKRTEMMTKRRLDGECSSSRGKIASASSSIGNSGSWKSSFGNTSLSLSEKSPSQPSSRRTRYWPSTRNTVTSVRTRKSTNGETRSKVVEHDSDNSEIQSEPPTMILQELQTSLSSSESSSSSQLSSPEPLSSSRNYSLRLGHRNENILNRQVTHPEDGSAQPFNSLSIDQDGPRRFQIDGIAEVLLALERIEHDVELTYEQLLVLETNLFLGGLGLHDQHRDMRLDIDNMSYEELLALGEKMGTVSTALTQEQLSNCLQKSYYMHLPPNKGRIGCGDDDVKCSICQEEYVNADEMGTLKCEHFYHFACIHQWLQLKNWCPICKSHATAAS